MLCYIKNCVDTVAVERCIRVYPNQKPWMIREVKQLLWERNTAFRAGDRALYSTARTNLKRGIRKAKKDFRTTWTATTASRHEWWASTSPTINLVSELLRVMLPWQKSSTSSSLASRPNNQKQPC